MEKKIKMEYNAPMTTVYGLSAQSMICQSPNGTSTETFTEDPEFNWGN